MKKVFLLLSLLVFSDLIGGAVIDINGKFATTTGEKLPTNWILQNGGYFTPPGKVDLLPGSNGNSVRLIAPLQKSTHFYSAIYIQVKSGDRIDIKAKAFGPGSMELGVYACGPKKEWLFNDFRRIILTQRPSAHQVSLIIKNAPKRPETQFVRVVISLQPRQMTTVSDVTAELYRQP